LYYIFITYLGVRIYFLYVLLPKLNLSTGDFYSLYCVAMIAPYRGTANQQDIFCFDVQQRQGGHNLNHTHCIDGA